MDQDLFADAIPNQTLDDQVLLLQTDFQHNKREVFATAQTAFTPDYDLTKTAFEAAGGDSSDLPSKTQLETTIENAGIGSAEEYAFFFANLMQESGMLTAKTESDMNTKKDKYDYGGGSNCPTTCPYEKDKVDKDTSCCGSACESKCDNHYHGRGYLQTTWLLNYKGAKDGGCDKDDQGKTVNIVDDPEKVATDDTLAWCTTAFFWKTKVHDDRGCPSCDLGATIHAINAAQECEGGNEFSETNRKKAQNRWCYYAAFYRAYANEWPNDDTNCIPDLSKNRIQDEKGTCATDTTRR